MKKLALIFLNLCAISALANDCLKCHMDVDAKMRDGWHQRAMGVDTNGVYYGGKFIKAYQDQATGRISTNAYNVSTGKWIDWTDHNRTEQPRYDECNDCHSSGPEYGLGVSCVSCHGPAPIHASNPTNKVDLAIWKDASPAQRDTMCLYCHTVDHAGEGQFMAWTKNPCVAARDGAKATRQIQCLSCHDTSGRYLFGSDLDHSCRQCHEDKLFNEYVETTWTDGMKKHDHSFGGAE